MYLRHPGSEDWYPGLEKGEVDGEGLSSTLLVTRSSSQVLDLVESSFHLDFLGVSSLHQETIPLLTGVGLSR